MEVILLADVKGVGKKNQTIVVSDGYANNYLLPRKLAVPKSKKSIEVLENQKENERIALENAKKDAEELAKKLETVTLEFSAKVGKDGKLFGGISLKQVSDELSKQGLEIDKRKFVDKGPLGCLGYHRLKIELFKGVFGEVKVHVIEDK